MQPADLDMSGRIEETNKKTVVALANGVTSSLAIAAREKRALIEELKRRQPYRTDTLHHVLFFSTLVFFLLRDHTSEVSQLTIDLEYAGYEPSIKEHVLNL